LAQTLSVLSRRMTRRIFFDSCLQVRQKQAVICVDTPCFAGACTRQFLVLSTRSCRSGTALRACIRNVSAQQGPHTVPLHFEEHVLVLLQRLHLDLLKPDDGLKVNVIARCDLVLLFKRAVVLAVRASAHSPSKFSILAGRLTHTAPIHPRPSHSSIHPTNPTHPLQPEPPGAHGATPLPSAPLPIRPTLPSVPCQRPRHPPRSLPQWARQRS